MRWQDYEAAAVKLYKSYEGVGTVKHNQRIPDRVTGEPRQIDVLIEVKAKTHTIKIVIDAKKRSTPVDVRVVESVYELAQAVSAHVAIIVCSTGWTNPAKKKADFLGMQFKLLPIEEALKVLHPNFWEVCPSCNEDAIFMDTFAMTNPYSAMWVTTCIGHCFSCEYGKGWCWDCGQKFYLDKGVFFVCNCGHLWSISEKEPSVHLWPHEYPYDGEARFLNDAEIKNTTPSSGDENSKQQTMLDF